MTKHSLLLTESLQQLFVDGITLLNAGKPKELLDGLGFGNVLSVLDSTLL